jgi:hypothetical protein
MPGKREIVPLIETHYIGNLAIRTELDRIWTATIESWQTRELLGTGQGETEAEALGKALLDALAHQERSQKQPPR